MLLFWKRLQETTCSCNAMELRLNYTHAVSDPLLLPKFLKLLGASTMASTVSLHTPVSINTF